MVVIHFHHTNTHTHTYIYIEVTRRSSVIGAYSRCSNGIYSQHLSQFQNQTKMKKGFESEINTKEEEEEEEEDTSSTTVVAEKKQTIQEKADAKVNNGSTRNSRTEKKTSRSTVTSVTATQEPLSLDEEEAVVVVEVPSSISMHKVCRICGKCDICACL
jgi:hypothetical protein